MKRLIAALLTVAMVVSFVPFSVLAEGSGTEPLPEASAESTAAQQEEMAHALESTYNPFGRTYAPAQAEESQTKQAEVDTSDVSMEATDSFGKLLLNSIDSQEGTQEGENRIIGVTVSGSTATVDYVAAEKADIVVAVYTDDTAERMTASGTIEASVTQDGEGKSTATVQLTGTIPNSFLVKAFLLDKAEHAPLSNEFTNSAYTKDIQDLEGSDISDFPEDRVVNLDDNNDTNFAVVNENVILVDATQSVGQMTISENGDGSYTITNADEKTKNLKTGDLFVYQDNDGILVLQIENIDVAGNTVTISGNEDLELIDVFDVVKIQSYDDGSQLEYDGTGVDEDVHYQGAGVIQDPLEETNTLFEDLTDGDFSATLAQKFVIGKDDFYKDEENPNDETHITSKFGINAVLNLKITAKLQYLINADKQTMSFTLNNEISGGVEAKYTEEIRIDLGVFKKELPGVYLNYTPQFVFKGDVTGTFYYKLTQKQGYSLENRTITNISERPVQEFSIKISGTVYLGVEMAPSLKIGLYKLFKPHTEENLFKLAEIKLTATVGAEGTITSTLVLNKPEENKLTNASLGDSVHICNTCLGADFYAKITLSVGIDIIGVWKTDASIMDLREHVYTCYYSQDFKEFGEGSCPHKMYLVRISVDSKEDPTGAELFVANKGSEDQSMGYLAGATDNYCYMRSGTYTLVTTINDEKFGAIVKMENSTVDVVLKSYKGESTGGSGGDSNDSSGYDPAKDSGKIVAQGSCGANLNFSLTEGGLLRISGVGNMTDYSWTNILTDPSAHPYEWYLAKKIVIEEGVTGIGTDAFVYCKEVVEVVLPSTLKTIGNGAFMDCDKLKSAVIPDGVALIDMHVFSRCTSLQNVTIPVSVKSIDLAAFYGCDELTDVFYCGTEKQWEKIEIAALNDPFNSTKMHIHYNSNANGQPDDSSEPKVMKEGNCGEYLKWVLMSNGVVTISGTGKMVDVDVLSHKQSWFTTYADDITQVVIEEGVTTVGSYAFDMCVNLESVKLPNSLIEIHQDAFKGCEKLWDITIPSGVTKIMGSAFNGCKSLVAIEIPDSTITVAAGAFGNCENLQKVTLPKTLSCINSSTFYKCSALTSIEIPEKVTSIGYAAFEMSGLTEVTLPQGTTSIGMEAFGQCTALKQVVLPDTIRTIKSGAFDACTALESIIYCGTESQWNKVTIASDAIPENATVYYRMDENMVENSITHGTSAETGGTYTASFNGLVTGASYAVIVSTSESDPLNPENLIYINQMRADSGAYEQTFRTKRGSMLTEADMNYVVAAGGRFIEEDLDQPVDPDTPSGGGGGGGAGAAIAIVGGVVAVAAVAGVVLMMPVEVSGTVKCADQAVLPAAVQVLQGDKVVAETVTDAEGRFTVKVRRGSYTLRVRYVGADGYPVTKTVEIKAPSKNMNVAA